jgi:hypothetical protein
MSVTKTARKESAAVFVDVSGGEYLLYRLTVNGVKPVFTLVDSEINALLSSPKDSPVNTSPLTYERRWPLPSDSLEAVTNHTLGLQFLAAPITYTYVVEHHFANGSVGVIDDIDFNSTTPSDWYFQGLGVTTD